MTVVHFLIKLFIFLVLSFESFKKYILDTSHLSDVWFTNFRSL